MFSLFLDGSSRIVPPKVLEQPPAPRVPTADQSFETHFQRNEDSAATEDRDDEQDVRADSTSVNPEEHENKDRDDHGTTNERQSDPPAASEASSEELESQPSETETADDVLSVGDEVTTETALAGITTQEISSIADANRDARTRLLVDEETSASDEASRRLARLTKGASANVPTDNQAAASEAAARLRSNDAGPADEASRVIAEPVLETAQIAVDENGLANSPDKTDVKKTAANKKANSSSLKATQGASAEEIVLAAKQRDVAAESVARVNSSERELQPDVTTEVEKTTPAPTAVEAKSDAVVASPQDRFAQQLVTTSGDRNARATETSDVQQSRFVDRVARAFRAIDGQQGGVIKLRLHPPELGVLQVQLKVQGNALSATMEAESPVARALLIDSLPILRERLAEQGIHIEQFDVDLMEGQSQDLSGQNGERPDDERNADADSPVAVVDSESQSQGTLEVADGENQKLNIIV